MLKLNKWFYLVICFLILIAIIFFFREENPKVCINDNCFKVEVVDTPQTREKGLMFREKLDIDKGMLFVFESEGNYPFWMKNTIIPLDMIWIDSSGKIIDIKEADPCKSDPCSIIYHAGSAKYVLEINKGVSAREGIEIGQIVEFSLI